jgi:hypothetical protein
MLRNVRIISDIIKDTVSSAATPSVKNSDTVKREQKETYQFRKETIAGMRRNGRDAPQAAVRGTGASPAPAFSRCDKNMRVKNASPAYKA